MPPRDQPVLYSADLSECEDLHKFDTAAIAVMFAAVLRDAGASIVREVGHAYPGAGLTHVLVLQESHAILHTWPETGTVNVDVFSCSGRLNSIKAVGELGRLFGARKVTIQEIRRADGHRDRAGERD